MAVVNNSFSSFLLTWHQFALVPSCCETSPLSDTSGGLPLVISLSRLLPCQHLLHLLLIRPIACLQHRSVSSSPLSFRPHACEICTCQMLCFSANLCWFLASYWSLSDSVGVSLEVKASSNVRHFANVKFTSSVCNTPVGHQPTGYRPLTLGVPPPLSGHRTIINSGANSRA